LGLMFIRRLNITSAIYNLLLEERLCTTGITIMKNKIYSIKACFYFILLNAMLACSGHAKKEQEYSGTQTQLLEILDKYKSEFTASNPDQREHVRDKYSKRLADLLVDSMGRFLDSMKVTVDTVIQEGWKLTTKFHTRGIEFRYGMTFKDSMVPKLDSLYQYLRALKSKEQIMTDFDLLGGAVLNDPVDNNESVLLIHAFPDPMRFQ
jgi:hypothetical protein